ncbi:GNAT family N-acetyltransferase [Chryseobacterium joostei]|uniref:GNAT family N-acetyltransferase n=1 Tax=Chryseobacterium joostei TaxID=112234 RepID=A0A1N7IT78_9FLAO|nr:MULTISPECIES: GNAT family N-acetyltransferase [Chryseobacterium]AZA98221.1 GNAT family N-acetyltransferase [Chryseobacterium joostei]SIS40308.1 putative acetyltransferase [Chryseobacterium joostei]HCM35638.1 N-acetyltransferase [Chryseobacterium sp.]
MNIEYRNLLPNESNAYRKIRLESLEKFPESFGANYQEALKTEKFRIENDIENQSLDRFVFGAFVDQELIGICAFVKDESNTGNIYQMYVREGFQGKNIGSGLIQAIINEANNRFKSIEIVLEVTPKNERAYHLYKKIGFQEVIDENNSESNMIMKYLA